MEDVSGQAVTAFASAEKAVGPAVTFHSDAPAAQTTETFRILHGSSSQANTDWRSRVANRLSRRGRHAMTEVTAVLTDEVDEEEDE